MSSRRAERCSFCGRPEHDTAYLVAGEGGVAICDECAVLAAELAGEALASHRDDLLVRRASLLVTNDPRNGLPGGLLEGACLAVRRGRISWIGSEDDLPSRYRELPVLDCGGRIVCPGFADASVRILESSQLLVDPEREARLAIRRLEAMLAQGITTVDLRVGGSVDPTTETTRLAVARSVLDRVPVTGSITWKVHPDLAVETLESELVPLATRLASFAEIESWPQAPVLSPLGVRLSCDVPLELELRGILSADRPLTGRDVPVVLEAALALMGGRMPAREIWDDGGVCALATGSREDCLVEGMGLVMALAGQAGLSAEEALWSATRGGAIAVGEVERGRIRPGDHADLVVLDLDDLSQIVRVPDRSLPWRVVKGGTVVAR